jgi:hypothetical protein
MTHVGLIGRGIVSLSKQTSPLANMVVRGLLYSLILSREGIMPISKIRKPPMDVEEIVAIIDQRIETIQQNKREQFMSYVGGYDTGYVSGQIDVLEELKEELEE